MRVGISGSLPCFGHCSCTGVLAGKGAFAKAIRSGLHGLCLIAILRLCNVESPQGLCAAQILRDTTLQ